MASESNGSNFLWFLAGAAVGAAIATLYSPRSGRETRGYIRRKSEEGREALADAGKEVVDRGREYYDKGRKLAEEAGGPLERGRKMVAG